MTLPGSHRTGIKHGCVVGGCGEVGAGEGGVVVTPVILVQGEEPVRVPEGGEPLPHGGHPGGGVLTGEGAVGGGQGSLENRTLAGELVILEGTCMLGKSQNCG